MKCECCQVNEAVVHFKQVVDGDVRELHICEECAARKGLDLQSPLALTEFLFGTESEEPSGRPADTACPGCGLTLQAFRKEQRLGCSECYEAFSDELTTILHDMHGAGTHVGKAPAGARLSAEIETMKKAMEKAIVREDFEEAARLRDALREIQVKNAPSPLPAERKVTR